MKWFMRFLISAVAAVMAAASIELGIYGVYAFYLNEVVQMPSPEAGSFGPIFDLFMFLIYSALFLVLLLFIIFLIFYKRLNMLGLLLGAGFGFWLVRLLQLLNQWIRPYSGNSDSLYVYLNVLVFVCMLVGLFFIKHDTKRFSLAGTVAGAASGLLLSYGAVIVYRWVDNTLTSFLYFDLLETTVVIFGILVFTLIGNRVGKKNLR
ncbi:hypothetical protein QOZ98_000022 [Planomicrobium stackebrandtii]|uniref:Uncharacterized protein n=1 Tax=Planomicrobium stackebrandtii TaxID=253160 RepID=A0ABU0GPD3_9BACL|nr:hypothetical protein [Planomicrobium stackebrandtii]MDQ0427197.1 hypothetical protein [Planomicrobium stackebrandtii]